MFLFDYAGEVASENTLRPSDPTSFSGVLAAGVPGVARQATHKDANRGRTCIRLTT